MITLSHIDRIAFERELGWRSFKHFVQMAWHIIEPATPLKWGWAMDAICDHLQAVSEGKFNRLLINIPPAMSKSILTGVMWCAWDWTRNPWRRFLSASHSIGLSTRDSMKCRRIIESEWYQARWPIKLQDDQNAKQKFENEKTGFRQAAPFTSLTGERGDILNIDDPISVFDGNSDAVLTECELVFRETVPTRLNNERSSIVVTMQRVNERDVSGIILKDMPDYVHLCLPMRFEPDRRCVTPIFADPRTIDGELLFPERFAEAQVASLERSMGSYATAGQLQQRPTPRGGGIFKDTWWQYAPTPDAFRFTVIYADTAQKTDTHNDFSVFQLWGFGYDGRAYLIDQIRDKWESPQLLTQARAFWNKHKARRQSPPRCMKIEDKSSGTGLIQQLKQGDKVAGHPVIPVRAIERNRDKVSRAYDVTPQIEAGRVVLPPDAPWLSDYLKEFATFPNGSHDDMIDPTMDAIADMLISGSSGFEGVM